MSTLLEAQKERFPLAAERAERKVSAAKSNPVVHTLLTAAQRARTARQRLQWVHRAADAWARPVAKMAPCAKGCSHCCHIPVLALRSEAQLLARASQRRMENPPAEARAAVRDLIEKEEMAEAKRTARLGGQAHIGTPCPFLVDGSCSVYEHRPFVCRTHFTLDDDDLLCRLTPGAEAMAPYADNIALLAVVLSLFKDDEVADLREWFPAALAASTTYA